MKQIVIVTRPNLIGPVSAVCEAAGFKQGKGCDHRVEIPARPRCSWVLAALSGVRLAAVQDGARPL